jgi:hypothetical protein
LLHPVHLSSNLGAPVQLLQINLLSILLSPSLAPLSIQYIASFWRFLAKVARGWRHKHLLHQTLGYVSMYQVTGLDGRTLEAKSERFCSPGAGSESFCRRGPSCRAMARIWFLSVNLGNISRWRWACQEVMGTMCKGGRDERAGISYKILRYEWLCSWRRRTRILEEG